MKTIQDYFEDSLPADIAAMAIRNTDESALNAKICTSPKSALRGGFIWAQSPQGFLFWKSVYESIESGDFRELEA